MIRVTFPRAEAAASSAFSSFSLFSLFVSFLLLTGCSSTGSSSGSASGGCAEFKATVDLTTPVVSFKTDVMPILSKSCAFVSCHGRGTGSMTLTGTDAAADRSNLVGAAAQELPTMARITPSDPANSYLLHKIDGDACLFAAQCTDKKCGDTMPQGNDLLDLAPRDTIRRWVAQGAKDN